MHLSYAQTQHIHSHILLHSWEHFGRTTALRGIQGLLAYYEDRKEISLSPFSSGHTNHWWLHTLIPRIVTSWKCSEVAPHLSAFSGKVPYLWLPSSRHLMACSQQNMSLSRGLCLTAGQDLGAPPRENSSSCLTLLHTQTFTHFAALIVATSSFHMLGSLAHTSCHALISAHAISTTCKI